MAYLAIQAQVSTILLLIGFVVLLVFMILFIIKEQKRYKKDKIMLIDDVSAYSDVTNLIEHRIKTSKEQIYFTLLLISIDDFDQIGDFVGVKGEDEYIKKLIELLRMTLPKGAKIAQLNERESFLVYLPEFYDDEGLLEIAQRFKDSAEKRVKIMKELPIQKNASVAVTSYPENGEYLDTLISNLQIAMLNIKKAGGNDIACYSPELELSGVFVEHFNEITNAIKNKKFVLNFNPIYEITKGRFSGVEGLLNWENDDGTQKFYTSFLPYLEEGNDEFWFGMWALEKATISNINIFRLETIKDYFITLNAGIKQLENEDSAFVLQSCLEKYQVNPRNIVYEIEGLQYVENGAKLIKNLLQLQGVGFKFMIDISKAGENALNLIKDYNIDIIKVSIKDILSETAYAKEILKLKEKAGKKVIVYDMDNKEQIEVLKNKNIDYIQGSFFGGAKTKDEILEIASK